MLSTTAFLWLVIRALDTGERPDRCSSPDWLSGLASRRSRRSGSSPRLRRRRLPWSGRAGRLRSWWTAGGAVVAVLLAAPYLVWQQRHGWPQVTVAQNIAGSAEGGRAGFIPFQLVMVARSWYRSGSPDCSRRFVDGALRPLRFLPLTYLGLALAYLVGDGKAYYLASLYPSLLGLGALPVAAWTLRRRRSLRRARRRGRGCPARRSTASSPCRCCRRRPLQGSAVIALNPDQGGAVGWPSFIDTIATAWHGLPPGEQAHTAIFTFSYEEAGAVDVLGRAKGLPHAYSGHNGFSEWGQPPAPTRTRSLSATTDRPTQHPTFVVAGLWRLSTTASVSTTTSRDYRSCSADPQAAWTALWPRLVHYE